MSGQIVLKFQIFPHFRTIPYYPYIVHLRGQQKDTQALENGMKHAIILAGLSAFLHRNIRHGLTVFSRTIRCFPAYDLSTRLSVQRFQQISGEETIHAHREANTHKARKLYSEAQLTLPFLTQSNREAKSQTAKERS